MVTYNHESTLYFYDPYIRSWTVYKIDENGYQVGDAEHYAHKQSLKLNYPNFKFVKHVEPAYEKVKDTDQIIYTHES